MSQEGAARSPERVHIFIFPGPNTVYSGSAKSYTHKNSKCAKHFYL